jgi:DNA-binding transcriptional ArsR family regulator
MNALDALGNPVRRQILELLQQRPRSVVEIADAFEISRPAISRHLKVLATSGLIAPTSEGTRTVYAVRPEGFESVRAYLERFWDDALPRFQLVAENLESLDD